MPHASLGRLDGEGLLRRVDSTTPTTGTAELSYRHPLRDTDGNEVAPRDWETADWDAYQGLGVGVIAALDRFLASIENCRKRARAPK